MNRLKKKTKQLQENNLFFIVFGKPHLYFKKLMISTISIGIITLILNYIYINTGLHSFRIPSTMHSLIGIVIGLLLVFRTNTAYDRWWEGRKRISEISASIYFIMVKINSCLQKESNEYKKGLDVIRINLISFMNNMKNYLKEEIETKEIFVSETFIDQQNVHIEKVMQAIKKLEMEKTIDGRDATIIEISIKSLIEGSVACERIKNTPIPIAYALHIKISILIYLITLPFGLFYDLGIWSSLMVMLVYYLIAGIEIISSEIENPFAGEPNDLPVVELIDNIIKSIK